MSGTIRPTEATLRPIRDTSVPLPRVDEICKMVPETLNIRLKDALKEKYVDVAMEVAVALCRIGEANRTPPKPPFRSRPGWRALVCRPRSRLCRTPGRVKPWRRWTTPTSSSVFPLEAGKPTLR